MRKLKISEVRASMLAIQRSRNKAAETYTSALLACAVERAAIRERCPHPKRYRHYNVDPAGGSGGWIECTLCKGEVRRGR